MTLQTHLVDCCTGSAVDTVTTPIAYHQVLHSGSTFVRLTVAIDSDQSLSFTSIEGSEVVEQELPTTNFWRSILAYSDHSWGVKDQTKTLVSTQLPPIRHFEGYIGCKSLVFGQKLIEDCQFEVGSHFKFWYWNLVSTSSPITQQISNGLHCEYHHSKAQRLGFPSVPLLWKSDNLKKSSTSLSGDTPFQGVHIPGPTLFGPYLHQYPSFFGHSFFSWKPIKRSLILYTWIDAAAPNRRDTRDEIRTLQVLFYTKNQTGHRHQAPTNSSWTCSKLLILSGRGLKLLLAPSSLIFSTLQHLGINFWRHFSPPRGNRLGEATYTSYYFESLWGNLILKQQLGEHGGCTQYTKPVKL